MRNLLPSLESAILRSLMEHLLNGRLHEHDNGEDPQDGAERRENTADPGHDQAEIIIPFLVQEISRGRQTDRKRPADEDDRRRNDRKHQTGDGDREGPLGTRPAGVESARQHGDADD